VLKKRIVFTLLYDSGYFMFSRNFRLQRVGDLDWLQKNYDFSRIAFYIDELVVLDVTRGSRDSVRFEETLRALTEGCFVPIAAGGGIRDLNNARRLLRSGADKIVINTLLFEEPARVREMALEFGQQCIVASADIKVFAGERARIITSMGTQPVSGSVVEALACLNRGWVGEIYLNSIDRDGTGQGYDLGLLQHLPKDFNLPVILAGGVGSARHLIEGFADPRVNAVATANLFNFVGDGLRRARESLQAEGAHLASWPDRTILGLGFCV
jgi:cyclase